MDTKSPSREEWIAAREELLAREIDLFEGRRQPVNEHVMFAPDWDSRS